MADERDTTRYLTVVGLLYPDNRLELRPGFSTELPDLAIEDRESGVSVELLGESGEVLLRWGVAAGPVCADGARVAYHLIAAKVPVPAGSRALRVLRDDVVVEEVELAREPPRLSLEWDPPDRPEGRQVVAWQAEHPEGRELSFLVAYSPTGGKTWQPLSGPISERELEIDFDVLPGGEGCLVQVRASDGFNTVSAESETFAVPIKPCAAMILSPEEGAELAADEPVLLQGQGFYLEEARPELEALRWSSSVDGPLGEGTLVHLPGLSPGDHEVVLEAGEGERIGRARTAIRVTTRGRSSARGA
jgi:hypothetical protein